MNIRIIILTEDKILIRASEVAIVLKILPANVGDVRDVGSIRHSGRFPQRRKWQTTLVSFP